MQVLNRARVLLWALSLIFIYVGLSLLLPSLMIIAILNGIFLGVLVAIIIVYMPLFWTSSVKEKLDRVSQLSLGIVLVMLSVALQKTWWLGVHWAGKQDAWRNSPVIGFITYIAIIGAALFVTAAGYSDPAKNKHDVYMGANRSLLISLAIAGGSLTFALSLYFDKY